jgi:hypothetical protein
METKTIETTWELWSYDVWGNARDGYEVNDRSCFDRDYPMTLKVETANPDSSQAFDFSYPTDKQIRKALELTKVQLDIDGDDMTIYVNRSRDGYPLGELHCTSHASLSPIRELP